MYNTIILKKGEAILTPREYRDFCKGDTIWGDYRMPKELFRWPIEQEEEAKSELAKYKCEYRRGIEDYFISEYGLEYCECDEDGDFVSGSDFDLAEEISEE